MIPILPPHLIGIGGPSGGGKTTLAGALGEALGEAIPVIPLDAYYRDSSSSPEQRASRNFDHPDAIDELCLKRRIVRDGLDRGRTEASVRHQWELTVRPMFEQFGEPTAVFADAVYDGNRPPGEIVDEVTRRFGW